MTLSKLQENSMLRLPNIFDFVVTMFLTLIQENSWRKWMYVILLLYVDGIILANNNFEEIKQLMDELDIHFEMNLQDLSNFVGLEMEKGIDGIFFRGGNQH